MQRPTGVQENDHFIDGIGDLSLPGPLVAFVPPEPAHEPTVREIDRLVAQLDAEPAAFAIEYLKRSALLEEQRRAIALHGIGLAKLRKDVSDLQAAQRTHQSEVL